MSNKNHRNHTNYNKISTTPAVVENASVETTPSVVNQTPEIDNTPSDPVEPIEAFVSGCLRLNVRKEPSLNGEVICELPVGTTLMIDSDKSTEDWFNVCLEIGGEGYCMKKFVTIKS